MRPSVPACLQGGEQARYSSEIDTPVSDGDRGVTRKEPEHSLHDTRHGSSCWQMNDLSHELHGLPVKGQLRAKASRGCKEGVMKNYRAQ